MRSGVFTLSLLSSNLNQRHVSHLSSSFSTIQSHPNDFISQFFSLDKILTQNPRDFRALSQLDSLLCNTQFFDSVTSVSIIEGLCRLKKLNRAKSLFLHLKDNLKVSPYFAFSLVFDCLVKDGKLDDVELQWGEISNGVGINLSDYVIYVCKFGEFDEVKRVSERVLTGTRVLRRQSYVALIGALCRYNEGSMAKSVLHEMYFRGFKVDGVIYTVIFQCLCRNKELDTADWVLRKMIEGGFDIDVCIYESFIHGLCKLGMFREARKLFEKLIKRDCFSGSKAKFLKEGRRVIFQLNYEGAIPEMMVYEMYIRSLCDVGKLDVAEILLKKIMKKRIVAQVCVYGSFIKALFRANREEDALKFFHVECKKGLVCSDELARYVFLQQCEKGVEIFDEFSRKGVVLTNSVVHCNCLLSSLWDAGKILEVERYFEQMNNGDLASPNLVTYRIMLCGFCNQGNIRKALDIFERMQLKNVDIDRFTYETVVTSLCKQGWLAEAYEYLDSMTKSGAIASYRVWKRVFQLLIVDRQQLED